MRKRDSKGGLKGEVQFFQGGYMGGGVRAVYSVVKTFRERNGT